MARREPVQKRSRERVEAIVQGAHELIATAGVENLSTRSLAAHTGIPVATIYRYFEDMDSIIAAYLDEALGEIEDAVEAAVLQLEWVTFRSMTEAVAMAHLRHHQAHPEGISAWFGTRLNAAVQDRVRALDVRMAASLHAATRDAGFIEEGPHFGAGLIVRLWDRTFEHIFRIERSHEEQDAIAGEVCDMISSFMERYATRAGLEGISSQDFLAAYSRSVGERARQGELSAQGAEGWGKGRSAPPER
jgi:AcrR family transcriptional regulator